ncbi:hypothetical protein H5410_064277 [Solanum commersonii]|uniref:60S ribosomal protein L29 n=1 Tax=Solanum commersonii TaxID=4109 RepID=A0A9J5W0K5_SOLCO|nr:hypothetical protein H5410_064277 [Solanum commersonii]
MESRSQRVTVTAPPKGSNFMAKHMFDDKFSKSIVKHMMDPKFLRNQRYARKHNKKNGETAAEE